LYPPAQGRAGVRLHEHALHPPEECIDCGACVPACPVSAIYDGPEATPANQKTLIDANAVFRTGDPGAVARAEELVHQHKAAHADLLAIPAAERAAAHA